MEKRTKVAQAAIGAFALSALALAMSGSAQAALTGTAITGTSIATGPLLVYDNAAGGNNAASGLSGAGAGPFAPASSVNITNSRHNLGSSNTLDSNHTAYVLKSNTSGGANEVVGTNQICVFCHTPHGFNTVQSGPLWNKKVAASSTYAVYNAGSNNSDTLDANVPAIGSVSLACLSCHDGTQAMDNMVNAPGSGGMANGFDASKSSATIGTSQNIGVSQGYIWGTPASNNGFALMNQGGAGVTSLTTNGDAPASEGIDLGTDLSNDHPISVQYCGGGIASTGQGTSTVANGATHAAGTCNDRLFNLPTTAYVNGQSRFWVDTNVIADQDAISAGAATTGSSSQYPVTRDPATFEIYVAAGTTAATGNGGDTSGRGFVSSKTAGYSAITGFGTRTKQDIMLFTNNTGVSGPSVECASCHDPHTPNNGTFLRVSNNGSGLCLSCHVK